MYYIVLHRFKEEKYQKEIPVSIQHILDDVNINITPEINYHTFIFVTPTSSTFNLSKVFFLGDFNIFGSKKQKLNST